MNARRASSDQLDREIGPVLRRYLGESDKSLHARYRSWEHCYNFFQKLPLNNVVDHRETAALHLGFYLASWGMYRGKSFLLQHTHTIHYLLIDRLRDQRFEALRTMEFGCEQNNSDSVGHLVAAIECVREAYKPIRKPTDILVTKILLGIFGALPAVDRYFTAGFKAVAGKAFTLNRDSLEVVHQYSLAQLSVLRGEQTRIEAQTGVRYPLMKLIDMYFWQLGVELEQSEIKAHREQ